MGELVVSVSKEAWYRFAHACAKSAAAAAADKFWLIGATNITVTFTTAPPASMDNVVLSWEAKTY